MFPMKLCFVACSHCMQKKYLIENLEFTQYKSNIITRTEREVIGTTHKEQLLKP